MRRLVGIALVVGGIAATGFGFLGAFDVEDCVTLEAAASCADNTARDQGVLTDAEFEKQKLAVLRGSVGP